MNRRQPSRAVDAPEPCFVRLRSGGKGSPWHAARVYWRLGILLAEINGAPADPSKVWHSGDLITEADYRELLAAASDPKPF